MTQFDDQGNPITDLVVIVPLWRHSARTGCDPEAWTAVDGQRRHQLGRDIRLHRAITKAAENKVLLAVFDVVHSSRNNEVWGELREAFHTPERLHGIHGEHALVIKHIQSRNPRKAEVAMRAHLLSIRRVIFRED